MFFQSDYFKPIIYRGVYEIPGIEQINEEGHRYYKTTEGKKYPSVSTVIGQTSDKSFLERWRKRIGEKEADHISRHARIRGTAVHGLCEQYLLGHQDEFKKLYRSAMADMQANWSGLKRTLDANITEVLATEIPLYTDKYRMAGTADMVAIWDGKRSIVDFKTSRKPKKLEWIEGYFVQCEAYAKMWEERFDEEIEQLVVLMSVDGQSEPSLFIEPRIKYHKALVQHRVDYYKQFGV